MSDSTNTIETFANQEYKWGFVTDIDSESIPRGLSEDVVRLISAKKNEPEWLLEWRLKAYRHWLTLKEPTWAREARITFTIWPPRLCAIRQYVFLRSTPQTGSSRKVTFSLLR